MTSMFVKYCGIHLFVGLSTDEKPTSAPNASRFYEMDTKTTFIFDKENEEWISQNDEPEGDNMVSIYFEYNETSESFIGYKDESKTPFTSQDDVDSFIGNNPVICVSLDTSGWYVYPYSFMSSERYCGFEFIAQTSEEDKYAICSDILLYRGENS